MSAPVKDPNPVLNIVVGCNDHAYDPAIRTLRSGFEAVVRRVLYSGKEAVEASELQAHDTLVYIGQQNRDFRKVPWAKLRSRGVRLAWFNAIQSDISFNIGHACGLITSTGSMRRVRRN